MSECVNEMEVQTFIVRVFLFFIYIYLLGCDDFFIDIFFGQILIDEQMEQQMNECEYSGDSEVHTYGVILDFIRAELSK